MPMRCALLIGKDYGIVIGDMRDRALYLEERRVRISGPGRRRQETEEKEGEAQRERVKGHFSGERRASSGERTAVPGGIHTSKSASARATKTRTWGKKPVFWTSA